MKIKTLLTSIGLGAGLMYFMDPQHGARRRTMVVDKANRFVNNIDESIDIAVEDARNRARILRDLLAANEMVVGRYYLRHSNFLAAINRFRTVVTDFQTTEQVEEALMRLTEAYMALGIVNEAQTAAAVLGHNFPESKWYRHAYGLLGKRGLKPQEHEGSWITRTWRGTTGT